MAILFQARKRSGATMSDVGAARTPARLTLDPMDVDRQSASMFEDDDPGPTQVVERQGKKQKPNDAHQAVADAAAEKAVSRVLQQMQVDKQQMQVDNERRETKIMESVKSTVEAAVGKLSGDVQRGLEHWEEKMDEKVRAQLASHQAEFEKKWATKIAQLEPGSQDGVISSAEFRIKKNIEEAMDKNWQNRMEKEDKININKFEWSHDRRLKS